MTRPSIFSQPDSFASAPLLSLLPVAGDIAKLEAYTSALYARFEQVETLKDAAQSRDDHAAAQKLAAESTMLRHVLDWLAVKPGGQ